MRYNNIPLSKRCTANQYYKLLTNSTGREREREINNLMCKAKLLAISQTGLVAWRNDMLLNYPLLTSNIIIATTPHV